MSENLTRLAQKIDFSKPITDDAEAETSSEDKPEEVPVDSAAASANLLWETIATKIRYEIVTRASNLSITILKKCELL